MMKRNTIITCCLLILILGLTVSCSKVEFKKMDAPAYLRVFNNLRFKLTVDNKEESLSVITMLINPVFDGEGLPVSAETVGDYLTTRDPYAPPYPSHIGNSLTVYNPEYPGKEKVMAAPILNGFDLSSWAQVPSGAKRIVFYTRPLSEVPFFQLDARFRKTPMIDTVLNLDEKEVYTLNVLQKDFERKTNGLLLRKEVFHKLPLSDSLMYVNFYNMSAKGFWEADPTRKPGKTRYYHDISAGIRDEMRVYYTLTEKKGSYNWNNPLPSHDKVYMTTMSRSTESTETTPYYSFPLLARQNGTTFASNLFQFFHFLAPPYEINNIPWDIYSVTAGNMGRYARLTCYLNGQVDPSEGSENIGTLLPNLIVSAHSGVHNPKSFATVSTIEIVNGDAYLTTVQRVYSPPQY